MREIKFRAWDKVNKKIGEVRRIHFRPYKGEECHFVNFKGEERPTPRCVLMQYTGLKDSNNVEIYEGDILRVDEYDCGFIDEVKWESGGFWFPKQRQWGCGHGGLKECGEVIGNIYENPELLNDNADNK